MSTIRLTFSVSQSPVGMDGAVTVVFNNGSTDIPLTLSLADFGTNTFPEIDYYTPADAVNAQQAQVYASSFVASFKDVGGNNNLSISQTDNEITITAASGTFTSGTYSGSKISVSGFQIDNSAQTTPASLSVSISDTGDCNTVRYSISASGGTAPYRLSYNQTVVDTSWDGSAQNVDIPRGIIAKVELREPSPSLALLDSESILVPRVLTSGDFSPSFYQKENGADITIQNIGAVVGTTPLEYSLISGTSSTSGGNYQTSNAFPDVTPGQYKLWVKDKYDCEISKIIDVTEVVNDAIRVFDVPEGQGLIGSEYQDFSSSNLKNYFNTGSYNQNVEVLYPLRQLFVSSDIEGLQFKSSYDYHYVTLHNCDGEKIDIPFIRIQKNLGVAQKLDCVTFPINGQTGVYFNGGSEYIPNTDTVSGASEYNKTTPTWNNVGQFVTIDGIGTLDIVSNGYDDDRGGYFVVNAVTTADTVTKIQATYNAQDYNLFEFYLNMSLVDKEATIIIEKGFDSGGEVEGNPYVIEKIAITSFKDSMLLLEWSDTRNKGGIVFQSGISYKKRCYGEFIPTWLNESETETADQGEYSLEQTSYLGFEILLEGINMKEVTQLSIASGLEGFKCNGLSLVRRSPPQTKRLGKSNLYTWKCEFAQGENNLAVKRDEIVLNTGSGETGSGGTGENQAPDLSGIQLYKNPDGTLIGIGGKIAKT